ncbi:flagellar brake protein [Deefgea rivuli]|uniref:flagellar brake protein n=1 Tax=Deefgea rivuli TaxID=400948 RepID=UPI00048502D2|nr:flagellar brake protein [Deefgea rivuli]
MAHSDLVPLRQQDLAVGEPVPYAIFDAENQLLLSAGQVIHTAKQLETLSKLGMFRNPAWRGVRVAGAVGGARVHQDTQSEAVSTPKAQPIKRHLAQMKLIPGTTLHIQSSIDPLSQNESVKLIGWLDKNGVLLSAVNSQGTILPFREGQSVKAKTIAGKDVISFEAIVEKVCFTPFPYLHLSWPDTLQIRQLRNSLRVNTQLIASVSGDGIHSIPARITNLSASGAMLEGSDLKLETDQEITMALRLHAAGIDHTMSIKAIVRNQKSEPPATSVQYGLEFIPLATTERLVLEHYIFSSILE